jgi:hypothetical protein
VRCLQRLTTYIGRSFLVAGGWWLVAGGRKPEGGSCIPLKPKEGLNGAPRVFTGRRKRKSPARMARLFSFSTL